MEYHVFTATYAAEGAACDGCTADSLGSTKTDGADAAALPAPSFYSTWNLSLILINNDEE